MAGFLSRRFSLGMVAGIGFFVLSLLSLLLVGCSGATSRESTPAVPPSSPTAPSATASPLPSETPAPTASPTATEMPLPTATFTITPTALPWADTVISAQNAAQLTLLKSWDRGSIQQIERVGEDRVVVLSTTGVYVYREREATLMGSFPAALQFRASPDSSLIAVNFPDGALQVIRLADGEVLYDIAPVADLPDFQLQRMSEEEISGFKRWHYATTSLEFSADSTRLAFAYIGGTIGVWELADGTLLAKLSHHVSEQIYNIVFTPDNQYLLTTGLSAPPTKVMLWSIDEQKLLWYQSDGGGISENLFSPDGNLYGMAYNGYYQLYTRKDGTLIGRVKGGAGSLPYSPDSKLLVSGDPAGLMIWRVQPSFEKLRTLYLDIPVSSAVFSEDGQQLLVNDGQQIYSTTDFSLISEGAAPEERPAPIPVDVDSFQAHGHLDEPRELMLSEDRILSVWGGSKRAWRWEPFTDRTEWVDFSNQPMAAPALSIDGRRMAACTDKDLAIFDFSGQALKTFERCLANGVLAFTPDGERLVWAQGANFHTVNSQDGTLLQDYIGSGLGITWLEFSMSGNLLASGGQVCGFGCTGDIHLWIMDPPGGVRLESEQTNWVVTDVAFSADEQWLYVAKRFVWLWDAKTGALKGRFPGEGSQLALSPDGALLAVGDSSGTVRLITTADRAEIASFQAHDSAILDLIFSPDGQNLVTLAGTGSVRLWGVP